MAVTMSLFARAPATGRRPEAELLLCCARSYMDGANAERIKALLRDDIDWVYLSGTALLHGMMPLLYRNLHTTCPEAVPTAVLNPLQHHFHTNVARNALFAEELLRLLNLLEAHGIRALPYKGPVLATLAHGSLSLREFYDLDILVPRADILRARDLFVSQGYRESIPLTRAQEATYLRSHHDYTLIRHDGMVTVELQWGVTQRYFSCPIGFDSLWERREKISFAGRTIVSPCPEDLLLVLCVHGSKHLWRRLGWICDVAELIRAQQDIDWEWGFAQARALGGERMLFLGLFLAKTLLGVPLPPAVLQKLQTDPAVPSLAAQVQERLFGEVDDVTRAFESYLFCLRVRERVQDKLRYGLRVVLTPYLPDLVLLPLPSSLAFAYYLLRPIRLIRDYGLMPLKRSLGF